MSITIILTTNVFFVHRTYKLQYIIDIWDQISPNFRKTLKNKCKLRSKQIYLKENELPKSCFLPQNEHQNSLK